MKKILLLLFALFFFEAHSQNIFRSSLYFNKGQSIPMGSYHASSLSENTFEIAKSADFGKSWQLGMDMDIYNDYGYTLNIKHSKFNLDNYNFLRINEADISNNEAYLDKHTYTSFSFGIIRRYQYKRFSLEPRISAALMVISCKVAEFYGKNSNNEYYKTIRYNYYPNALIGGLLGLNSKFDFISTKYFKAGFQLFSELTYINSDIIIEKYIVNKSTHSATTLSSRYNQNIFYMYFGLGINLTFQTEFKDKEEEK